MCVFNLFSFSSSAIRRFLSCIRPKVVRIRCGHVAECGLPLCVSRPTLSGRAVVFFKTLDHHALRIIDKPANRNQCRAEALQAGLAVDLAQRQARHAAVFGVLVGG